MVFLGKWPLFYAIITLVLDDCSCALDLQGWISITDIPSSFSHIPTTNVLRCGQLCERQGICVGATFDHRTGLYYLHSTDDNSFGVSRKGRYMHKSYKEKPQTFDSGSVCDKETHIVSPSAGNGLRYCQQLKGLIGQSCSYSSECLVDNSECGDGYCRCKLGYGFLQRTQSCYKDCSHHGNTFQRFKGKYVAGYNTYKFPNKTNEECARLCFELTKATCKGYEDDWANKQCFLHPYNIPAQAFGTSPKVDYYQRNCE